MVVAKTDSAHRHLAAQLEDHSLARTYQALVWGHPRDHEGLIDAPLARDPRNRLKISVREDGKPARTHYTVLALYPFASLLEWRLETGRTHQIRVHSRYAGHPVVGDPLYDGRESALARVPTLHKELAAELLSFAPAQLLQSVAIEFTHPATGKTMRFEAPLEPSFEAALKLLEAEKQSDAMRTTLFQVFSPPQIHAEEEEDTAPEEPVVEVPELKERKTRAERYAEAKERRRLKKIKLQTSSA
jgi:23S rRNA pseudouridine1911/1915/1917 synthase